MNEDFENCLHMWLFNLRICVEQKLPHVRNFETKYTETKFSKHFACRIDCCFYVNQHIHNKNPFLLIGRDGCIRLVGVVILTEEKDLLVGNIFDETGIYLIPRLMDYL